jgi:hypothetical protein
MRVSQHAVVHVKAKVCRDAIRQNLILIYIDVFFLDKPATSTFRIDEQRWGQHVPLPNCTWVHPKRVNKL